MKAYPAYKDSGVEWLGMVPEGWEVKRLRHIVRLQTEKATTTENPIALENIEGWSGRIIPTDTEFAGDGVAFAAGDILFGKLRPYLAKVAIAETSGEAVGDFHVMRPLSDVLPRFLQLELLTPAVISTIDSSTYGSKMPRVGWDFMADLRFPIPPLSEQQAIAAFLDHETAKIDGLIEEQRRLIALLAEKRQATISHAVTRGLNPDASLKPSGVDWLGDVPEGWEVVRTGYRYEVQLGRMLNEERASGENMRPYLRVLDVQWGQINTIDLPLMDFPPDAQRRYRLLPGDLLVNEGGSYVGRSAIWRGEIEECYYQKALHRLRPRDPSRDTAEFFYYVMDMATRRNVFVAGANQTTIDHLTAEQLRAHRFAFPPYAEQVAIAEWLSRVLPQLDTLTQTATTAITFLQERRAALISAAVTGKIDVLGLAPVEDAA